MTFDWSEYLNLARKLAGTDANPGNEAELRSAISRAYYAAFITARNYLRDRDNIRIPRERSHQFVINQFRESSDNYRAKLGRRLLRLRNYRVSADYHDTVPDIEDRTHQSLTLARRIILALENL